MVLIFFASAPKGLTSLLMDELSTLGGENLKEHPAGVGFEGSLEIAYRACLWSRMASRILLQISQFEASTPELLYNGVQNIDWSKHFASEQTFAVDCNCSQSVINHSHFAALKIKDAIVDQFRDLIGDRPSIDLKTPDLRINAHINRDIATLSIDLSGDALHRRGYRKNSVPAPMKENLASAILIRSGWKEIASQGGTLLDPMCGSGTILIEAAQIASDIAPGLLRDSFGFKQWKQHQPLIWKGLIDEAIRRKLEGLTKMPTIYGYDSNGEAVHAALANVEAAQMSQSIHVEKKELSSLTLPHLKKNRPIKPGLVITNPPYGERLGKESPLHDLYASLGDTLKNRFEDWQAAVITGNPEVAKNMAIRCKKQYSLFNGALPCKLLLFDLNPTWFIRRSETISGIPLFPYQNKEDFSSNLQMFTNRITKNRKELMKWAKREHLSCYRVYDADLSEYSFAIDLFQGEKQWIHVQEYQAPKEIDPDKVKNRLREVLSSLPLIFEIPVEQIFYKVRAQQKGKKQYEKQAEKGHFSTVYEEGDKFLVNFTDYLDVGLFLDHRKTRSLLGKLAKNQDVLNLFSYTGTATVRMAKGGAHSTTSVDMSRTYLNWSRQNMQLNKLEGREHKFIQADCLEWIKEEAKHVQNQKYGLIFLDPPTFSRSKRMAETFDIQRDHVLLIQNVCKLLTSEGVLIFSNNYRNFKFDQQTFDNFQIENLTQETIPKDFKRNPKIHNCWKMTAQPHSSHQ